MAAAAYGMIPQSDGQWLEKRPASKSQVRLFLAEVHLPRNKLIAREMDDGRGTVDDDGRGTWDDGRSACCEDKYSEAVAVRRVRFDTNCSLGSALPTVLLEGVRSTRSSSTAPLKGKPNRFGDASVSRLRLCCGSYYRSNYNIYLEVVNEKRWIAIIAHRQQLRNNYLKGNERQCVNPILAGDVFLMKRPFYRVASLQARVFSLPGRRCPTV